jgi:hypothetical protein
VGGEADDRAPSCIGRLPVSRMARVAVDRRRTLTHDQRHSVGPPT